MITREIYDAAPVDVQVKLARIFKALHIATEAAKIYATKSADPLQASVNAMAAAELITRLAAVPADQFLRFQE